MEETGEEKEREKARRNISGNEEREGRETENGENTDITQLRLHSRSVPKINVEI